MATKIVTKNSSTASAVPTASDLVQGELAVNVADKRLFTEDNGGSIVELGTNPSTIDINAGSIDGTTIGASSASTGAFTTLTATGLTVDTDTLYVDSTNNRVGIGTTTVNADLHINKSSGAKLWITAEGSNPSDAGSLRFSELSDGNNYFEFQHNGNANKLNLTTSNGDLVTFDRINKRVGIGTSSPTVNLDIQDSSQAVVKVGDGSTVDMRMVADVASGVGSIRTSGSTSVMAMYTGGSERLRIDSSGAVGIGTSSPTSISGYTALEINNATSGALLDLSQGDSMRGRLIATATTMSLETSGSIPIIFQPTGVEAMRIDSSGNLLVGTTSTPNGGHVLKIASGTVSTVETDVTTVINMIVFRNGNGNVGTIQTNGSTTTYNTSSDQRLKENIADADDAGSKIDAIQVRQYDWKVDGSHQDYGMIAQELQTVAPEAVSGDADSEEMMGVDYSKLVPMLIKEIQSLRNRVAQLEE